MKELEQLKEFTDWMNWIYHCVVREEGKIKVFECPMDEIDIKGIKT